MATATITSKGQITIPVSVREEMGADVGDRIEFVSLGNGRFEMVVANVPVQSLKGMIRKPEKSISIEDMNEAIARQGAAAR